MTKVQIKKNQYKGALPRQAKLAVSKTRPSADHPSAVGKKLNEVMRAPCSWQDAHILKIKSTDS